MEHQLEAAPEPRATPPRAAAESSVDHEELARVAASVVWRERVEELHREVLGTRPAMCSERAVLITRYFRKRANRRKPAVIGKAEALAHVLNEKSVRIYPRELLVGCFSSHRVGGAVFPELHGIALLEDLFRVERRRVNPLEISNADRLRMVTEVFPFWLPRFLGMRMRPLHRALRIVREQLSPKLYLLIELGGISHFVPDYHGLVTRGTDGFRREARAKLSSVPEDSEEARFLTAIVTICDGLDAFAENYRREAERLAEIETDAARRDELYGIAEACARVPRQPARTFREALQAVLFGQIALNLESLDNAISPGRLDQILWPLYRDDLAAGRLDREGALELLGCYAVKMCEIVPAFSRLLTSIFGGMFNGQVVVVGGVDERGADATNELTYLFLEVMDRLRSRQPNYHARIHRNSPAPYRQRIAAALASGSVSPALYNDDVIVPMLRERGMVEKDALDYATVGCVEPVSAGRSYLSTDASLVNLPLCLELAMNRGRRFGSDRRLGAATPPVERCGSVDELIDWFAQQVRFVTDRLLNESRMVEEANARWHPTPLASMLVQGCMERMRDASRGGARYNGSGIQGVGVVEVGDSFAALEHVLGEDGKLTVAGIAHACREGFDGHEELRARLRRAPKYGNDDPTADRHTSRVMEIFADCFRGKTNYRGGEYVAGFYSVTAHQAYGEMVGALPSGRLAGEAFSSGISPSSGLDRRGPTAALLSQAALPLELAKNGVNFNIELAPWAVAGEHGARTLRGLVDGAFDAGCMQMQVNVLDPQILIEARDNPGRHPGLLVRVSGYSAYFDDLSPEMQQEIIDRTLYEASCVR